MATEVNRNAKQISIQSSAANVGTEVFVDGKRVEGIVHITYRHSVGDVARLDLHCIATDASEITGLADVTVYQIPLEVMAELQMLRNIVQNAVCDQRAKDAERSRTLQQFMQLHKRAQGECGEAPQKEKETEAASGADQLAQRAADSHSEVAVDSSREERDGVVREGVDES